MQIFLTEQCQSLSGSLGRGYGYHIQRRKNGFFSKRNSKGVVPPDGHWKFILTCAKFAQIKLYIRDLRVTEHELLSALREAGIYGVGPVGTYNTKRIVEFCKTYRL